MLFSSYSWTKSFELKALGSLNSLKDFGVESVTTVMGFLAPVWFATLVPLRPSLDVYTNLSEQFEKFGKIFLVYAASYNFGR